MPLELRVTKQLQNKYNLHKGLKNLNNAEKQLKIYSCL